MGSNRNWSLADLRGWEASCERLRPRSRASPLVGGPLPHRIAARRRAPALRAILRERSPFIERAGSCMPPFWPEHAARGAPVGSPLVVGPPSTRTTTPVGSSLVAGPNALGERPVDQVLDKLGALRLSKRRRPGTRMRRCGFGEGRCSGCAATRRELRAALAGIYDGSFWEPALSRIGNG